MYNVSLLKKLRRENGLTQQQVADCLSVDRSTYAYYESGRTRLNIDTLIQLSRMYQLNISDFLSQQDETPDSAETAAADAPRFQQLSRAEQTLIILYRSGGPEQRKALLAAAAKVMQD